jgi:glycosyltransferase involved in cell wall biosynthesis
MAISIIGTVGVPSNYGGFESLVENLLPLESGTIVYCSSGAYEQRLQTYKGAELIYVPLNANGFQSVLYDIVSMLHTLLFTKNDFLILGVSGAIFIPLLRLLTKRMIVINIDGVEWRRAKWGRLARKFLRFSEGVAVRYSNKVIADNQAIAEYVSSVYRVESEVIAYGGDHSLVRGAFPRTKNYALSLCRIEKENNVDIILAAFANCGTKKLIFVGNWDRSEYGRSLKAKYSMYPNIILLDSIYDLDRLFILRAECDTYVHGHSAGGTNPSLVEMMFFGKRTLCFDCVYNRASTEDQAEYFKTAEELANLLCSASNETDRGGDAMREIADRKYQWSDIRASYIALFGR